MTDDDEIVLTSDSIEYVDDQPDVPATEFVYFRKRSAMQTSWLCLAGGIAALLFAALGFAAALLGRVDQFALQALVTGPVLIGLALLGVSRLLARSPSQVTVGPDGICIDHDRNPRVKIAWTDVAWATVGHTGLMQQRQLLIYDAQGKTLAALGDSFEDFKRLTKQVQTAVAKKQDAAADDVRRKKSRSTAVVTGAVSLLLSGVAIANFWMAIEKERTTERLASDAVEGEAQIVRRFIAPNGVTKRLEYLVTGDNGRTATRNAEVTNRYWESLESASTVPVRYVPAEPSISALVDGEVISDDWSESPGTMKVLSMFLGALSLVFFASAVLQWYGWDIDLDSRSGKVSIKRLG